MTDVAIFAESVLEEFDFLRSAGFSLESSDATCVRFCSALYHINVYHGRHSFEVHLEVERAFEASEPRKAFGFQTLVRVFDEDASRNLPVASGVSDEAGIRSAVHILAAQFRRYIDLSRFQSADLWSCLLAANEKQIAESPYPKASADDLHRRFDALWKDQRYKELVNFFSPLRDYLGEIERNKLDIAKRLTK